MREDADVHQKLQDVQHVNKRMELSRVYVYVTLLAFLITWTLNRCFPEFLTPSACAEWSADDQTINHPLRDETFPTGVFLRLCFTSCFVVSLAVETSIHRSNVMQILSNTWNWIKYVLCGFYWCIILMFIVKLRTGRPRPCFLAACVPVHNDVIGHVTCSNPDYRLYCVSFFSGHAMLSSFTFTYIACYVYSKRIRWSMLYYLGCMSIAVLISYSRIHDNMHHTSDVIVGALVGISCALCSSTLLTLRVR